MADTKKIKTRKIRKNVISEEILEDSKDIKEKVQQDKKSSDIEKKSNKRVKSKKIRMSFTAKEEQQMDKQLEMEDNISIGVIIIILVLCFVVGISLGYFLYRIAINSSNVMFIVKNLIG